MVSFEDRNHTLERSAAQHRQPRPQTAAVSRTPQSAELVRRGKLSRPTSYLSPPHAKHAAPKQDSWISSQHEYTLKQKDDTQCARGNGEISLSNAWLNYSRQQRLIRGIPHRSEL